MRAELAVLAAVAALAAGCGGEEAVPQLPSRALDVASADECARGGPRCLPGVVGEMTGRLASFGCDHRAPFLLMYRQVTREVDASVRARRYRAPEYVAHLDAAFSRYYFRAADLWAAGRRDAVPGAWRVAFAAAGDRRVSALGDMLLGMNAHISRDLPYALAEVGLSAPGGADATPDVVAINDDIARSQDPMLRDVAARFDPTVTDLGQLGEWVRPDQVGSLIAAWRREAVTRARELLAARTAAERRRVDRVIDTNATMRALLVRRVTRYAEPRRGSVARDRYCAGKA